LRRVIIIAVGVAALAGLGAFAARAWIISAERSREIEQSLDHARTLNEVDATRSDAIVALETALGKLDPERDWDRSAPGDCIELHRELADACMRLDPPQVDKAIRHLERAFALAPASQHAALKLSLAQAHFERYRGSVTDADFKAARDGFLEVMTEPELEADAMHGYAMLHLVKGRNRDLNKALEKLDQLLARHPDYADAENAKNLADSLRQALSSKPKDG